MSDARQLALDALQNIEGEIRMGGYADGFTDVWKQADEAITALQADLAAKVEPVAWAMLDPRTDGLILDVICPDEHDSHEGAYTIPLYASPPLTEAGEGPLVDGWKITVADGHAGYGVYAHMMEYPEEGAILLLASPQQAVPAGFVLVPIEPTEEMYKAYTAADNAAWVAGASNGAGINEIWDAMLEAAPRPAA